MSGLDLLMIDETNPRSIFYQLKRLEEHFGQLPQTTVVARPGLTPEKRLLIKSLNDIQLADLETLTVIDGMSEDRKNLKVLLKELIDQLETFSTLLSDQYFDHQSGPQQLTGIQRGVYL